MVICKKGDTSRTVKSLQLALIKLYGKLTGNDGSVYYAGDTTEYYGTATSNGVKQVQEDYGLTVNGDSFDSETLAEMLIALASIPNQDPALKAELDAAKKKIVEINAELTNTKNLLVVEQNQSASLASSDSAKKAELVKVAGAFDVLEAVSDKY